MTPAWIRVVPATALIIGSIGLSGCATKGFVREQIATVSQRIDALDSRLLATDGIAKQAQADAQAAAGQGQNSGQRIDQLNSRVDGIEQRLQERPRKRARN